MDLGIIVTGLLLIGLGFLVRWKPDLLAGYNTLSQSKKENVDIEGLSKFARNGLITMGLLVILGFYLLKWLGWEKLTDIVLLAIILPGSLLMVLLARRYDYNKKKNNKVFYIVIGGVLFVFCILLFLGLRPMKVIVDEQTVRFTGPYGIQIDKADIESVTLTDTIPAIIVKTNGLTLGPLMKGVFKLDSWGKSRLLLNGTEGSYLVIGLKNGEKIIVNHKDRMLTEGLYENLRPLPAVSPETPLSEDTVIRNR